MSSRLECRVERTRPALPPLAHEHPGGSAPRGVRRRSLKFSASGRCPLRVRRCAAPNVVSFVNLARELPDTHGRPAPAVLGQGRCSPLRQTAASSLPHANRPARRPRVESALRGRRLTGRPSSLALSAGMSSSLWRAAAITSESRHDNTQQHSQTPSRPTDRYAFALRRTPPLFQVRFERLRQ